MNQTYHSEMTAHNDARTKWQPAAGSRLDRALNELAAAEATVTARRDELDTRRTALQEFIDSAVWQGDPALIDELARARAMCPAIDLLQARVEAQLLVAKAETAERRRAVNVMASALAGHAGGLETIRKRHGERAPETKAAQLRMAKARALYLSARGYLALGGNGDDDLDG